jgi:hypothetical protein
MKLKVQVVRKFAFLLQIIITDRYMLFFVKPTDRKIKKVLERASVLSRNDEGEYYLELTSGKNREEKSKS